jgi:hypothetical protein
MTRQVNVQLDNKDIEQLEEIVAHWNSTRSRVVSKALDILYEAVFPTIRADRLVDTREPYRTEAE